MTMTVTPAAVAPPSLADGGLHASIVRLARGASVETSTPNLHEIDRDAERPPPPPPASAERLPAGADFFAAWLPGTPYHHLVSVAKRLRQAGFNPVPHIA